MTKRNISQSSLLTKFNHEFNLIYQKLSNDSLNQNNSTKLTIFLWDNTKFLNYLNTILASREFALSAKLNRIIGLIKNHIVNFHYPTQSIVSNKIKILSNDQKQLRLSSMAYENVSFNNLTRCHFNFKSN